MGCDWTLGLGTQWLGQNWEWHACLTSTNQRARDWVRSGAPAGAAVVAARQTAGRGRRGRAWWSPDGGLYTSFVLYPPPERASAWLSLLGGVAVCTAIRQVVGLDAGLKWPNDVLVRGKKCAGILVETGTGVQPWAVLGIGINVAGALPSAFADATTLETVAPTVVSPQDLWQHVARALELWYRRWLEDGDAAIRSAWCDSAVMLGVAIDVMQSDGRITGGVAEDIDSGGALLVRTDDGRYRRIVAGDVSIRFHGGGYGAPSS